MTPEDLSIKSEKAMREVQRLGQEIEIEYELKAKDDDDIQEYKRTWVGLTRDEQKEFLYSSMPLAALIETIETRLRIKNL